MRAVFFAALALGISSCSRDAPDGPPAVHIDESECVHCGMIISDERWATATIVQGDRGPEPLLFDDFNCQVNHETEHPELRVVARWSRSHSTLEWVRTERARFLASPQIHAPMGSGIAAFSSLAEAETARSAFPGELMDFRDTWDRLIRVRAERVRGDPTPAPRPEDSDHEP